MKYILVIVEPSYVPQEGTAFDAVFGALDFCEIPARIKQIDADTLPTYGIDKSEKVLTEEQREPLIQHLIEVIAETDSEHEMFADAVEFGRVGVRQMCDASLIETADFWSIDLLPFGIDEETLARLRSAVELKVVPESVPAV